MKNNIQNIKNHNSYRSPYRNLFRDLFIVCLSVFVSVWVVRLGLLNNVGGVISEAKLLATFMAGFFFTSAFTIAPATIILATLAKQVDPFWLAFWGALGALCGDMVIFFFVRDRFTQDINDVLRISKSSKLTHFFHTGYFRWLSPLIGAVIIASPLPDELGMTMMGMSKTRTIFIVPISFCMNFLAIWLISHIALAL